MVGFWYQLEFSPLIINLVSPLRLQSSFITAHPSIAELSKRGSLTLEINDLDNILPLASDNYRF